MEMKIETDVTGKTEVIITTLSGSVSTLKDAGKVMNPAMRRHMIATLTQIAHDLATK